MANSYTAIPNIVPGNLTVNGNLKVSGGQIAVGKFPQQYRIQEMGNGWFVETVNIDRNLAAQDDPTAMSEVRVIRPSTAPFNLITQPAGVPTTDSVLISQNPNQLAVFSQELRVGAATPFVRLVNSPGTGGWFTVNLGPDLATRDDITKVGQQMGYNLGVGSVSTATVDTAGHTYVGDLRRVFWLDHSGYVKTGSTTLQAIATKTVYGNQLSNDGGIFIRVHGIAATVAGGGVTIFVVWGGTSYGALAIPASLASAGWIVEAVILNRGSTNAQVFQGYGGVAGTATFGGMIVTGIDSTLNQNLTINTQNLNPSDSVTVYSIEAEFMARSATL